MTMHCQSYYVEILNTTIFKNSLSIILFSTMLVAITSFRMDPDYGKQNNDKNGIEGVFNRHLEFNDLVKIKLDMSQQGICLEFQKIGV